MSGLGELRRDGAVAECRDALSDLRMRLRRPRGVKQGLRQVAADRGAVRGPDAQAIGPPRLHP